jgi:tetratricopeptide (TPR) repeat protein
MRLVQPRHDSDAGSTSALGVPRERLAFWVGAGLARPPRDGGPDGPEVDLCDATLVRSLCDADHPGMKPARLRRTLDRLRAWLPTTDGPPGPVTLVDGGRSLLVRLANGDLADPSGQFRLDFDPHAVVGRIGSPLPTTPRGWHERGVEQELAGRLDAAADSYARALLLGGPDVQVTFDLAHALAGDGQGDRAIERYRQVVELDPLRQDAWVNLGDLLLSAGRTAEAIGPLRRALDLDPDDPDAHYNLAEAFDLAGQPARAAPHWEAFLHLGGGPAQQRAYARARFEHSPASRPNPRAPEELARNNLPV